MNSSNNSNHNSNHNNNQNKKNNEQPSQHHWPQYPHPYQYYYPPYGYPPHMMHHVPPQYHQMPPPNQYPMPQQEMLTPKPMPIPSAVKKQKQRSYGNSQQNRGREQNERRGNPTNWERNKNQKRHDNSSNSASDSDDEEQLYQKTKLIAKKRDPVMDTPEEIKKWVQARRRNYPSSKVQPQKNDLANEMSILEKKIRKKIMLVSSDGRGLMKKMKNMDILRRIISENKIGDFDPTTKRNLHSKKKTATFVNENPRVRILQRLLHQAKSEQKEENVRKQEKEDKMIPEVGSLQQEGQIQSEQNQSIQQHPIIKETPVIEEEAMVKRESKSGVPRACPTPEDMIAHLKQKQGEDTKFYGQLLSYKSNSLNYKYNCQTLDVNFLLEDIFEESSYLLQAIRHIVKKNFFRPSVGVEKVQNAQNNCN